MDVASRVASSLDRAHPPGAAVAAEAIGVVRIVRTGEAYHLRPGHFVQTLEPVQLLELSPVEEHDRTMARVARNMHGVAG